ncbi:MAG: putative bifunctional diguanylate cyclase/phosphodiesterase, partial [Nocardioides sp.]
MSETGLLVSLALAVALGVPAWLLERASVRRPADRAWLAPLALGATLELLSRTAPVVHDATGWPALEVVGHGLALAAPVLLLGGLVLAVRQRMGGVRVNVLIDGLAGALAGACVAALVLAPLADRLWDGTWQSGVALGRPLLTSALSAAAVGALSLLGTDHLARFGTWAAGTTVLAGADIAAAAWPAQPLWGGAFPLAALALVAAGAHVSTAEQELRLPGPRSLGVPAAAATVAVATLAVAPQWSVTAVPSVLALVTLAVSTVRFVRVFLQLRELAAIREQALTDELTGIANRRALYLHLDKLLQPADGDADVDGAQPEFAVALIDLDHFKEVNDTLGHATGDALLKGVVGRFAAALEELETPHLLARLGGDEFAVVLHEATTRNAALIVGEALAESLAEPLELPDTSLHAHASIGLAAAPLHGRTRGELLFAADAAMYAAKTSGDAVRFHAPKVDEKTQQLGVAEDLYLAVERRELFVEYQPVRTAGGELVGVEALVRWQHPERGRLEPSDFLEAAERYRLTGAIAERVLDIALGDLACWRAEGVPLTLTVNLSIADLRDEAIVSTIANALLAHRLPAKVLTLDLGEAGLAPDLDRVKDVVTELHDLGVRLCLDDYGTGGTSLTALMALPLHSIKIDRRFIRDAAINPRLGGIVRASVDLTHSLGLRVVAEGVEDKGALAFLAQLGCDLVQGWHVGRPTDAAGIDRLLAQP